MTSFVPDLDWNPLEEPGSNARYGEHYAEPVTPLKTAAPLNLDGSAGTAAIAPRTGTFNVTLVTVQLSGKTVADTDAINMTAARNSITNANAYWKAASAGRLSITKVNEYRHKSAAKITDSYGTIMATVTKELSWQYRSYEALVVFVPHADLNYNGSWGILGGGFTDSATSGRVIMPYPSALTNNVVTHEFGHVLGLHHANSLACNNARSDVPRSGGSWADPACYSAEYSDTSDLMGYAQVSSPRINAFLWEYGGFGTGQDIRNIGTPSSATRITLKPWAGAEAGRAIKFTDPVSKEVYYVELRLPIGADSATATGGNKGVKITKKDVLGWSGNASIVLTPNSLRSGWGNTSLTWQVGQTFRTHAGTTVKIDSVGTTSASVTITPVATAEAIVPVVLDKSLAAVNAGDFNGNGTHDLVSRRVDGTLWFHDGTGTGSFRTAVKIGSGWGIYSQIIGGQDFNGDKRPDLVARKTDGTLWFYAGTGVVAAGQQGYKAAVKVGSGWKAFDIMVSPGDFTGDAKADLIARKPDGTLWLYRGTGTSPGIVTSSIRIGTGGWTGFDMITGAGDYTGDGRADLLARKPDGTLWLYQGTGTVSTTSSGYQPGRSIASGWSGYADVVGASDFNRDGKTDLVGYKTDLSLWFFAGTAMTDNGYKPATRIATTGWQNYSTVLSPGDYNRNGTKDLIARKKDGTLWFFNGDGKGGYGSPLKIGSSGWNVFTQILAPGDFNADGRVDLLARHTDGSLWFYAGTGTVNATNEGYKPGRKIGNGGWQAFTQLMTPGDYTSDGKPDLLGRKTDGTLWLWAGTGSITNTAEGYTSALKIGNGGWQNFNHVITPGDFNADKRVDLIARKPDGTLWFYAGTGTASTTQTGYKPARKIGTGWNIYSDIFGPGNFTNDTKTDLLATRTDGSLWLFTGTGMPTNSGYTPATTAGKL
ncbi:FG-GAP-like repeat-containing protein [Arthrobacter sp. TMS2-4]